MEYTVDALEKQTISQMANAKILGSLFTVELSSAPAVAGTIPIRATIKDDEVDSAIQTSERLALSVFDDADLTIPSVDTVLQNATTGSLLLGTGTNLIMARTNASGLFECDAVCSSAGVTRYLSASSSGFGSGYLSCRMIRTLVYP